MYNDLYKLEGIQDDDNSISLILLYRVMDCELRLYRM